MHSVFCCVGAATWKDFIRFAKVQMFLPGSANVMALVRSVQLAFAMVRLIECLGCKKTIGKHKSIEE